MCRKRRRAVQNQTSWISPQGPADETETAHAWPKQPMGYTHAKPRMMVANAHSLKKENSRYDKIGHCNSRTMILLTRKSCARCLGHHMPPSPMRSRQAMKCRVTFSEGALMSALSNMGATTAQRIWVNIWLQTCATFLEWISAPARSYTCMNVCM